MNQNELISHFQNIKVHTADDRRNPNKPLTLLLALGRLQQEKPRLVSFAEIEEQLEDLLEMYGRPGKPRPEYPFWHLRTAEFWEIPDEQTVPTQSGSASIKYRRDNQIKAGFTTEAADLMSTNPDLMDKLAIALLQDHFPDSLHQEILDTVGFGLWLG